jgi:hypothetical protein
MSDDARDQPTSPEDAIRSYLLYLDDPAKLRDEGEVQARTVAVLKADDPIEKLKALAALEKASAIDEKALRERFIEHAGAWAADNGISVRAFRELNVPDDVLVAAGFEMPAQRARRPGPGGPGPARESSGRRPAVSTIDIKEAVLTFAEPFTLNEVMAKVGGSPMTVRKAVEDLIADGKVEKQGPVPGYSGRGRAPIQYALVADLAAAEPAE